YPIVSKIAARVAMGILFSNAGMDATQINRSRPWIIADIFDFAPALALAEDLTTTDVIGRPPRTPLIMLPIPCALSSTFVLTKRFRGSILSVASIQSKVSIEATIVMVTATTQTPGLAMEAKAGVMKTSRSSSMLDGTGKLTK